MRFPGRSVAGGLMLVGVATMTANAASYVLSIVAARVLSVPEYGALGAMLSISIIGGTAALAIQAVGARRIASAREATETVRREVSSLSYLLAAIVFLVGFPVAWPVAAALDVPYWVVFLTIGSIAASILGFSALGVAQGEERNARFALAYAAIGVVRAGGGVLAMIVEPSVLAACIGIFAGSAAGSVLSMLVARYPRPGVSISRSVSLEFRHTMLALLGLFVLSNTDVLLARIYLDPEASGVYSVGALIGKIAFFLPTAINSVLFPKMVAGTLRHASLWAVGLTSAVGVAMIVLSYLLGTELMWVLGGAKYSDLSPVAWLFALEGSIFAIVQVVLYAGFSSRGRGVSFLIWGALLFQIAIVAFWLNSSIIEIVAATTAVAAVLVMMGVWWELGDTRRGHRTRHDPGHDLTKA